MTRCAFRDQFFRDLIQLELANLPDNYTMSDVVKIARRARSLALIADEFFMHPDDVGAK